MVRSGGGAVEVVVVVVEDRDEEDKKVLLRAGWVRGGDGMAAQWDAVRA